jgi:hypothetical protein
MIYHKITSGEVFEIYLNLQELLCLKTLTNQKCAVIPNNVALAYFDLSAFEIMGVVPSNCASVDLSDCVCMFNQDLNTQSGLDLISSKSSTLFRLDKFNYGSTEVIFSKPNHCKEKYIIEDTVEVKLNEKFISKYKFIANLIPPSNLLLLKPGDVKNGFESPFNDCYYVIDKMSDRLQLIFEEKQIKGFDLKSFITNYHPTFKEVDFNALLLLLKGNFLQVYSPSDCVLRWCLI